VERGAVTGMAGSGSFIATGDNSGVSLECHTALKSLYAAGFARNNRAGIMAGLERWWR
jgi:hypothetical protein